MMAKLTDPGVEKGNTKKRRLNKFTMKEISIVGTPAQEPALIAISKSAAEEFTMDAEEIRKQKEQMAALEATVATQTAALATQTATIEKLSKVAVMSPDIRKYYEGLEETGQTTFLQKSVTLQEAEVQNSQLANAIIYKDRNGIEYRKSDDSRLVQMAKDADEQDAAIKKMQTDNTDLKLQKMADDFKFLPGDDDARLAIVKAVDGISDETQRKAAFEILKSKNTNNGRMFTTAGVSTHGAGESIQKAESDLDELVQKHMTDNKVGLEKAYDEVLQTPEGAKLYEETELRIQ